MPALRSAAALLALALLASVPARADELDVLPVPAAVPEIEDGAARAAAEKAHADLDEARQRLARANDAYAEMRARDYPRGNARAQLLRERDAARRAYERAEARYAEILAQSSD